MSTTTSLTVLVGLLLLALSRSRSLMLSSSSEVSLRAGVDHRDVKACRASANLMRQNQVEATLRMYFHEGLHRDLVSCLHRCGANLVLHVSVTLENINCIEKT